MNRTTNKRPLKRTDQFDIELFTTENPQRGSDDASKSSKRTRYMMGQAIPEQGWQRCQSGFDGVITKEEEERRGLHQLKSRGAKRFSLSSTKPAQEGSSLDIDWSSSSESLSDVEPLQQEPLSTEHHKRASHKKRTIRKARCKTRFHQGAKLGRLELAAGEEDDLDIVEDLEEGGGKRGVSQGDGSKTTSMTEQGQPTLEEKKSSQIHISDYDSPSEDQFNLASSSQQGSSSLHISDHSPTPQPSPVQSPSKESPRTGTELLKRLKLPERTPDKEGATGGPSGGGDSGKKKKKFVRGGLAEDLQRVMNREKSSMAFWSHRTIDTAATNQSPALDLLVLSLEEVRGLFITRCQMQPLTSEVNEETLVLFSQANGRQLKLGLGSRVRVHPPWQKLTLPDYKQPVILCTYFCQSVEDGTEGGEQTGNQASLFPNMMSGPSLGEQLRPLQLFQPRPIPAQTTTKSTLQSVLPQSTEAPKGQVSDSFLDSIAQTGMYSSAGMCVVATFHRVYHRRCLPEATLASRKFLSHSHAVPAKHSTQWTLLIQDSQGVFCELQVTLAGTGEEDEEEEWRRCLRHGERKTFVFSGLKVMRRVNRTRSPGLFSLIDSMWSPCEGTTCQTDTESQDSKSQGLVAPQSFCYILGVQTLKNSIREEGTHRVRIPYREPVINTLGEIEKMSDISNQRVACYAKLVYAHPVIDPHTASQQPQSETPTTDWHLFLTDHSLSPIAEDLATKTEKNSGNVTGMLGDERCRVGRGTRLMYVYVRRSCSAVECEKDCFGVPGCLVLLRDLCCEQGHLHADTYTNIDNLTESQTEKTERSCSPQDGNLIHRLSTLPIPPLPDLGLHSDQHTLVSISGVVTGVDEATAYSWPACDTCGNDRLQVDPNSGSELHCKVCQRSVTSPSTRMHLEITMDTPALGQGEAKIKVQLLQSSIEQVLPPLSSQEDGYDMQCIMGINIGPISCFLRTVSRQHGEPVNFDLEEVSLEP
ncbi:DNA repair-scaffolding protein-like isoform X1 [Asterias rubens]|uniref:DNA repair-scaffolding protein-like isoform X1 n=2 Tax=Asterias rubens TaxID=7604 RepID=UPI00145549E2|nr:DNA repair-scaffolding protein-like isoform X1 [Asterias rubens]